MVPYLAKHLLPYSELHLNCNIAIFPLLSCVLHSILTSMIKLKLLLLISCLIISGITATAQSIKPELAVVREQEKDPAVILAKVKDGIEDTSQIQLILKAARIYYNNVTPERHELDTVIMLAKKAYLMSRHTKYGEGIAESAFLLCKVETKRNNPEAARRYLNVVNGEAKARLLLVIAEFYCFNFDSDTKEFKKSLPLIVEAQGICRSVNSFRWQAECQVLLGKFYFSTGNIKSGINAFMIAITAYENTKKFAEAAAIWSRLGGNIPESAATFPDIKKSHENAIKDYLLANDKEQMAYCLRDLAILNGNFQHLDSAEQQLLRVVSTLKSVKAPIKFTTYNSLADFYRYVGKYDKALYYALEARKAPDVNQKKIVDSDWVLASIYERTGKKDLALHYYQDAHQYLEPISYPGMYLTAFHISLLQAGMDKVQAKKALIFLNKFLKIHEPDDAVNQQRFAYAYGDIFAKLGDYNKAESYYRQMIALDKDAAAELGKRINSDSDRLPGSASAFVIGKFYLGRNRFNEAKTFLQKSLIAPDHTDAEQFVTTYRMLFKADSALNNYPSAIRNLQRYQNLNDSINSIARARQLEELHVKYDTDQKEKNIKLLENKQKLQEVTLQRTKTIRNFIIWGAAMLVLVLVNKQRSNTKLTRQRKEINNKNLALETLLIEKDDFLKEKDWLLKEIHHRVKNNLQIIISLLSTQSEYLENNIALEAIQESQNRVNSIALIHQKLYRSENPGSIYLPEYVSDLIENLADGFDIWSRKIVFEQNIGPLNMDLSQAVPLGLILNESITNAIKYAFGSEGGTIVVCIVATQSNRVKLSVEDNGCGLPHDFDINSTNSLGMDLIKGLSKQLRGDFGMSGLDGVKVSVEFDLLKTFGQ